MLKLRQKTGSVECALERAGSAYVVMNDAILHDNKIMVRNGKSWNDLR